MAATIFGWNDIRNFVTQHGLQLVTTWCLETQHMFIAVRKPARRCETTIEPAPVLLGARPSGDGYSRNVPRRGRQAAVSLWIAGLPEDCGLTDLEVCFSGARIIPCHIALGIDGVRQVNALLPRNFQVGPFTIGVAYRGHALAQTFELEVIEGDPQRPVIVSVSDGENLALQRKICSGELKIAIENVDDPNSCAPALEKFC